VTVWAIDAKVPNINGAGQTILNLGKQRIAAPPQFFIAIDVREKP
jgi:hypothetical protein